MATRTLSWTDWMKLVVRHVRDDEYPNLNGYPPADAAHRLDVSRERVGQLVRDGVLDTLQITTRADRVALTLITQASLERYLAERVPDRGRQGYFAFPQA